MGRVLLAALPREGARRIINASNLAPRTTHSVTDPKEIMASLELIRTQGYAIIDQEVEVGLRSIAVPLLNERGQKVGALNIGLAATHEKTKDHLLDYLPKLLGVQTGLRRIL